MAWTVAWKTQAVQRLGKIVSCIDTSFEEERRCWLCKHSWRIRSTDNFLKQSHDWVVSLNESHLRTSEILLFLLSLKWERVRREEAVRSWICLHVDSHFSSWRHSHCDKVKANEIFLFISARLHVSVQSKYLCFEPKYHPKFSGFSELSFCDVLWIIQVRWRSWWRAWFSQAWRSPCPERYRCRGGTGPQEQMLFHLWRMWPII